MLDGVFASDLPPSSQVISSISQALEMSSPRSASWMLERFGLTATSGEDERCLMINPAVHRLERDADELSFAAGDVLVVTDVEVAHKCDGLRTLFSGLVNNFWVR